MDSFRNYRWLVVAALVAVVVAPAAFAQLEKGSVSVTVTDNNGDPLPGVTVTLSGYGADRIQVTNAQGQTNFVALDPGTYEMSASLEGFSTVEYPQVQVRAGGSNTALAVSLSAAVEEVITVTSESPLLDEKKIKQGTTITGIELEKIPSARDPWSVLNQTPGVSVDRINVGGNESGQQSNFNAPGMDSNENTFLVDGIEITDMAAVGASSTYFDFEQFTEMQFTTGGTDVNKSAGGVTVNLITKRGTNEFRGSARIFRVQPNFFDALTQTVPNLTQGDSDLAPNQSGFIGNSINRITEYGVEAGGPVLRDKLWFWGSFGVNDIKNLTGGASQADVQSDDTILENTSFKVNAQISGSNSALGSWNNGNKEKFGRNASPTRPQPTTWDQRGPSAIIRFEDTHVFNSNFFLTGTYGKVDGGFSLTSKGVIAAGGDPTAAPETTWNGDGVWGNSWIGGSSSRPSEEWKIDGSYFFNTGAVNHELKFGTRFRDFEAESPFHWPGRDVFHVDGELFGAADPADFLVAHRGETPLVTQEYSSFWVQDTFSTGNLTINAGLRYDIQDGFNEEFTIPGNPAFPSLLPSLTLTGGKDKGFSDWETISPRIGLTYALGEERKSLLRASYSQFPEQLQTGDISRVNPLGDVYAYFLFYDADGDEIWTDEATDGPAFFLFADGFDPNNPTSLADPDRNDPNLDPELTSELILGVEHAFLPEFVVGATYTYRNTTDVKEARTLINDPVTGQVRTAVASDYVISGTETVNLPEGGTATGVAYVLGCAPGCDTNGSLLLNGDREVEYSGFSVNFTKRLANRWMARGYVQVGEAEWDVPGSYFANNDPTDFVGSFDNDGDLFAEQAAGSGAKANVFLQSGWQWNLTGLYQVAPDRPWGFNVSANIFGREGTPLPYFTVINTAEGNKSVQLTPALDTVRSDDVLTVDLRLEKEFAATGNVGFTVSLDAFNLFDESYVLQRERRLDISAANFLRETLSPRIFRLGVRLNWR